MNRRTQNRRCVAIVGLLTLVSLVALSQNLFACATCGCGSACKGRPAGAQARPAAEKEATINTAALEALIDAKVPVVILDARTGKYDDGRRIPGARNVGTSPEAEVIERRVKNKGDLIVTYCSNLKCPASSALHNHLKKLGYTNVVEYPHGIDGWVAAGNRVEREK